MDPNLPPAIADPEKWLRDQQQWAAAMKERADRAQRELAGNTTTLTSRDHAVTVTVNPSGVLLDLRLSSHADRMSGAQLTASIMETYRKACGRGAARTVEIMSQVVGDDSEAMDFLRAALPPADEDDDQDRPRW
ncbi:MULTISPECIES: YbaB/EbfC family nucleoid-associated protein [Actinomadura]|jgi:DNA-binding protein YbaB|uniref:YbaB/EbfC family nucleoid-associated protein n=1 Tax=Actinomadura montaniterrae TaxID=1803903 RepID=A0A6L3VDM0_9ACTN|nr:YbaB/EbfC family nucleoid-associated protein [Actinomadura montaniterrae]KAB2362696.1 YbaB/EbfC family nucleoid-associated protein [Actinomadura montaniterrae]